MADDRTAIACPYCQTVLAQPPHRDEQCPDCGHLIIVRQGRLMTEEEARLEQWLARLIQFNITRSDFENYRLELSQRLGVTASIDNTLWRILRAQVAKGRDPDLVHRAYKEMFRLAGEEGQDLKPYVAEAQKIEQKEELQQRRAAFWRDMIKIRSSRLAEYVQVQTCDDDYVCPTCKLLASELYRVNEVPELPYEECQSEGGCRCSVAAVPWRSRDVRFQWIRFARRVNSSLALTIVYAWGRSWRMRLAQWWAERHKQQ
jgi:hypothetical protein